MPDWKALLEDPAAPLRVMYVVGQAESPADRYGRSTLRVWRDGSARLDQKRMGVQSSWTGRVPADRVATALVDTGFPEAPTLKILPGGTRRIYARSGATSAQAELPLGGLIPPAWLALFALLDGAIAALGGAALSPAPPDPTIGPGSPVPRGDPALGQRWLAVGAPRAVVVRTLPVDRSWVDAVRGLPRSDEVTNGLDLRGLPAATVDFGTADLGGADLTGADLEAAKLRGARLAGARLVEANLAWARLGGADLQGVDLSGANLADADLRDADLRGANLAGAELREADLTGARLDGAHLGGTILQSP